MSLGAARGTKGLIIMVVNQCVVRMKMCSRKLMLRMANLHDARFAERGKSRLVRRAGLLVRYETHQVPPTDRFHHQQSEE